MILLQYSNTNPELQKYLVLAFFTILLLYLILRLSGRIFSLSTKRVIHHILEAIFVSSSIIVVFYYWIVNFPILHTESLYDRTISFLYLYGASFLISLPFGLVFGLINFLFTKEEVIKGRDQRLVVAIIPFVSVSFFLPIFLLIKYSGDIQTDSSIPEWGGKTFLLFILLILVILSALVFFVSKILRRLVFKEYRYYHKALKLKNKNIAIIMQKR